MMDRLERAGCGFDAFSETIGNEVFPRVFDFLKARPAQILTLVLLLQASLFYGFYRNEARPQKRPLSEMPRTVGDWQVKQEGVVDKETADVLKADELLNRTYASPTMRLPAYLFVAYFNSQRTGQKPHSPKNCLPGSGWVPTVSQYLPISIPGRTEPISVNRYVVAKGDERDVVLYWYQSRDRVVAGEYSAQFYVLSDALKFNRTDTALVRVIVPVLNSDDEAATNVATEFVKTTFPVLRQYFPA
jgi:EpsI family protein